MGVGPVSLVNRLVNEIGSSLGIVFGQSEDGSRLCDHKHLPVGGRGGPDNGSTLTILYSWIFCVFISTYPWVRVGFAKLFKKFGNVRAI